MRNDLERDLEERVEALGFELVELERKGHERRPILRLRIDRRDAEPGEGVTLDECAQVSRSLESWLDELDTLSPRYVLEVSSPGVDRPLRRPRDWERFEGREVAVVGRERLADRSTRLEGVIRGLSGSEGEETVSLELSGGTVVSFRLSEVKRANLVFRWDGSSIR